MTKTRTSLLEGDRPNGFFPTLYESVVTTMGEHNKNKLEQLAQDRPAVIDFVYGLDNFRERLKIKPCFKPKNVFESRAKREYGNKAYAKKKDLEALHHYNEAVIAAPGDSRELCMALANRSAVLAALKAFPMALDDIRLALESGYPKESLYKLLDRRAKIELATKQLCKAQKTMKELLNALDQSSLNPQKKLAMQKETQKWLHMFQAKPELAKDEIDLNQFGNQDLLPVIKKKNESFPAMADCVDFEYRDFCGRFAVASRDIEVGELICVEKPIVSRILPDYMGSNCNNCFLSMKAPLACGQCSSALFCSYECRQKALRGYHRYECQMHELMMNSGMSVICFTALRAVTQRECNFFVDNYDKLFRSHDETNGVFGNKGDKEKKDKKEINKVYRSMDYSNLFNLVTHGDERKFGDIFHRAMMTVMLLRCLQYSAYFGNEIGDDGHELSEKERIVAFVLNHFLELMQFNTHEVAQFEMVHKDKEEGASSTFIGAAVYPTLALFNHSCDPSVVRYYIRDTVCVQAIKNIRKGEQICENYGPIFYHSPKDDRQDRLKKQYWFDCVCVACQEDWPLREQMTEEQLNFRCAKCSAAVAMDANADAPVLKCPRCGAPLPILKALKAIGETEKLDKEARLAMQNGDLCRAQTLWTTYLVELDKHLCPPYADYFRVQQSIWKCIWMRHGNRIVKANAKSFAAKNHDDINTVD